MPLIGGPNASGVSAGTTAIAKETRWRTRGNQAEHQQTFPEAATSDFKKFELVKLSSGKVTQIATIPSALGVSSSVTDGDLILGMALADASGTTDTPIPVIIADGNTDFLLRIHNATATSAQEQDVTLSDLAELFRYAGATTATIQTVVSAAPNGTNGINQVRIIEKLDGQPDAAEYGWVWAGVRAVSREYNK